LQNIKKFLELKSNITKSKKLKNVKSPFVIPVGMKLQLLNFVKSCKEVVQQIVNQNVITAENNKIVYESEDVTRFYAEQNELQKPETAILKELKSKLPEMRMLDIGVGGGRTTTHFAFLTKEYLGIDYSSQMVNACIKKFQGSPKEVSFLTADARTMKSFKNNSFDFVLFSFNGIDYMEHEDRLASLREIRRLIRSGGYFCFSTHNLNFLSNKCSIQLSKHPSILASRTYKLLQMRLLNEKRAWKTIRNYKQNPRHDMVNDGAHNFQLRTYYITPFEQVKQLSELGFSDIKMYSLVDGSEIKNPSKTMDHWVYFLSRAS
jgi:ubiquinone/menaquinone biosynthesis C-methylase UbiE